MATTEVAAADPDLIEIPPGSITAGHDPDGLPKTIPTEAPPKEQKDIDAEAFSEQLARAKREAAELRSIQQRERSEAQSRIEAETNARIAAEKKSHESTGISMRAHWEKLQSDSRLIDSGITNAQTVALQAKKEIKEALEAQNGDQLAEAQSRLARSEAELMRLEEGKLSINNAIEETRSAFRAAPAREEKRTEIPVPTPPKVPTPEEWIAACPPATQSWLQEHREFVTDPKLNTRVTVFARSWADEQGVDITDAPAFTAALNSPAFVQAMDAKFFPEPDTGDSEATTGAPIIDEETAPVAITRPAAKPKSRVVSAAPVSRSNLFSSTNLNAKAGRLPADLAALCKTMGMDPTQYYLETVEQIRKGEKPKEWLDPGYDRGIR